MFWALALLGMSLILQTLNSSQQDVNALQYASEEMKADRDIAIAAVKQRGMVLECLGEEMKRDREVCEAHVQWARLRGAGDTQIDEVLKRWGVPEAVRRDALTK